MSNYNCEVLADSLSPQGKRLITFKVTYPRIIHAEMCRHRVLSRNTASSRAIPFKKMVKDVEENPFIPLAWQKSHKGMQGSEYIIDEKEINDIKDYWLGERDNAIFTASELNSRGVTKQLCNRLLEPFVWVTEIISGTEWKNFFELRCPQYELNDEYFNSKKDWLQERTRLELDWKYEYSQGRDFTIPNEPQNDIEWLQINRSQADIHIQAIAELMWDKFNESTPKQLQSGEWHIPDLGHKWDESWLKEYVSTVGGTIQDYENEAGWLKIRIATAHCAKISYDNFGTKVNYEADIRLHDRLLKEKHASPMEHCAKAMSDEEYNVSSRAEDNHKTYGWCKNYQGWIQYRHLIDNQ